jgi:pyruvate dehydrogenase E1 component beta subunit
VATDISALVAQKAFGSLRAPVEMVTAPHTPVPFSNTLEDLYMPDAQRIVNAVKTVAEWAR